MTRSLMTSGACAALIAGMLALPCVAEETEGGQQLEQLGVTVNVPQLIPTLKDVTMLPISIQMDGRIGVKATGETPTTGWIDPHLYWFDQGQTSTDKYHDLVFFVIPPLGGVGGDQVVTHTAERTFLKDEQGEATGVRVWGANGCIEIGWQDETSSTVKPWAECLTAAGMSP